MWRTHSAAFSCSCSSLQARKSPNTIYLCSTMDQKGFNLEMGAVDANSMCKFSLVSFVI